MKTKPCFFLLAFLLYFSQSSLAQLSKGQWLADGRFSFTTFNAGQVTEISETNLSLGLGLMVAKRWAVGAGMELQLRRLRAEVGSQLWMRYYLLNQAPVSLFTGLHWQRRAFNRIRNKLQRPTTRVTEAYFLQFGVDYFISPRLILEGSYQFGFLTIFRFNEAVQITDGNSSVDIRLCLLLESNRQTEPFAHAPPPLQRGQWALGGAIALNPDVLNEGNSSKEFDFRPQVSYFVFRRLALGLEMDISYLSRLLNINLGALAYTRYFVPLGKRNYLFADAGIGYTNILVKYSSQGSLYVSDHLRSIRYGLGYTIFVTPQLSFDLHFYQLRKKLYKNFPSHFGPERGQYPYTSNSMDVVFSLGLQYYLFEN